eukprot:TRINITY_DN1218_c0_g1_i3.p1 TRINITY_DN1218_c0_g1~~TRINITY_DN1218_c0_g1_i3.p1  ORF type:complete len:341 (-),score=73.05 TRINITY_DN1218_c0_g1_i3:183-1205(-)
MTPSRCSPWCRVVVVVSRSLTCENATPSALPHSLTLPHSPSFPLRHTLSERKEGKLDAEALNATSKVLEGNPDFYVAWNNRREILLHLQTADETAYNEALGKELSFSEKCIAKNPKSYWVWLYRRWITMKLEGSMNWTRELGLCEKLLDLDSRNFHCWNYRREVSKRAGHVFADDLLFTEKKIKQNFSNYSAWHQRSFLLPLVYTHASDLLAELLKELELVRSALYTEPADQSGWIYHRWLTGTILAHMKQVEQESCAQGLPSSPAEFLCEELAKQQELRDLEPDSKWVIVTCVYLRLLLLSVTGTDTDTSADRAAVAADLQRLSQLDPPHAQYYAFLQH